FYIWQAQGPVTRAYYSENISTDVSRRSPMKYSTSPDDLLRESAFCLIPAAPIANYIDLDPSSCPSMTVDRMGCWSLIVEGANTYSPDPGRKMARARMEREVYREQGVLIATDYLVNSGGVIFAAQEHLIKTPDHLRIPDDLLGDREAVDRWLTDHIADLEILAEKRRVAGETYRDEVIRRNMGELIDILVSDADIIPCEAAERVSIRRIASRESDRVASDIMEPIPTAAIDSPLRHAASMLIETSSSILAVVSEKGELAGVVTEWDITKAVALGCDDDMSISEIMNSNVISVSPDEGILEMVRKLEHHEISAMPVVDDGVVVGMVSSDLLARRSLLRLLQSQST
ncbi:MAG: CBS domain-containing protein, partial [Anaerolineales bacterium]|nr:CBS domain-containing protein [Anaerolineales bacterium]